MLCDVCEHAPRPTLEKGHTCKLFCLIEYLVANAPYIIQLLKKATSHPLHEVEYVDLSNQEIGIHLHVQVIALTEIQ